MTNNLGFQDTTEYTDMNQSENLPTTSQVPPQAILLQMTTGVWVSQSIYVVTKLGIPDLLKQGSHHCDDLATKTGTHSESLYRVLRALASVGIFEETQPRCFQLTHLGTYLQSDVPGSMRAFTLMMGEEHYLAWNNLIHSVQTGETAFQHQYGMDIFEYYRQNPEPGKIFEEAMTEFSVMENGAVVEDYDFSGINQVVDVGGGQGSLVTAILQKNPTMQGVVFDQPYLKENAQQLLEKEKVQDRCKFVGGDFFDKIFPGGDAYMLKHIVHDWDDEQAIAILQRCHQAMSEQGRLLVIEQVIPPGNQPFPGKFLDLNMLVMAPGGRERTAEEYRDLFQAAGFNLTRIVPTKSDVSVVEGVRITD